MRLMCQWWSVLAAAVLSGLVGVTVVAAEGAQFLPVFSIREGATRFALIPRTDGYIAYLTLLNERDGGINGVKRSGPRTTKSPCSQWAMGARMRRMGGCFRMSLTP